MAARLFCSKDCVEKKKMLSGQRTKKKKPKKFLSVASIAYFSLCCYIYRW